MTMSIQELRKLREQLRITQKEVAEYLGVSKHYIFYREHLNVQCNKKFLERYEKFLKSTGNFGNRRALSLIQKPKKFSEIRTQIEDVLFQGEKYNLKPVIRPKNDNMEINRDFHIFSYEKKVGDLYQFKNIAGGYTITLSAVQLMRILEE